MKTVAFVFCTAFLLVTATAQARQIDVGVKLGLNSGTLVGDDVGFDDVSRRTAFGGGAFLIYRLNDRVSIQPEVLLMNKGAQEKEDGFTYSMNLTYLEVPVLARVSLGDGDGSVAPHLLLGPALGFNTSCKLTGRGEGVSSEVDCDEFMDTQSMEFGIVLGGGIAVPRGTYSIVVDGRYHVGLADVFDNQDVKTRTLSLMGGVTIPVGARAVAARPR